VYLRVSSKDGRQDEANQEPDCARLCAARGWQPIYLREQESGVKARPVWAELKERVRRGETRRVVFWALDRIGRTQVQVAHDLGELFRWGAVVTSVQDAWVDQPEGPMRELLTQIMAWAAEGERRKLIARTRAGLDRARAKGVKLGRRRVVSEDVIRQAVELRRGGETWGRIAKRLGVAGHRGAVQRAVMGVFATECGHPDP
jgi:DNA invertase Pin-like site-specific DNA recombinase